MYQNYRLDAIIEVKDLKKNYGDLEAVKGITLSIPRGKIFGFLGPNGAGKTTSLKIFVGLLKATSGTVHIDGLLASKNMKKINCMLGLIPQDLVLWEDLTVEENLLFVGEMYQVPMKIRKEKIDSLLKEISLEDKRNTLVRNLSGGLKRRLNIIMGLVHDPEIVVADEPTPGLDPQSRSLVWDFLRDLTRVKNKTVILTTHFMDEADRLSDMIAIMDHGELLVVDTPENLRNSIGEGDLIELQFNEDMFIEKAANALKELIGILEVKTLGMLLQIRCLNAPSRLTEILNIVTNIKGLEVVDMKIRKTTLEDVFLHLTGRALRD